MKKILLFSILALLLLVVRSTSMGQVSISSDGSEPHPSAMLEIKSSGKGFLLPKVQLISLTSPAPILNPAVGLIVHNYSQPESTSGIRNGVFIWDGARWRQMVLPAGQSPNELIYWDGQQLVTLGAGSPGQVLTIGPDSSIIWSNGCGGVNPPTVLTTNPSDVRQTSFKVGGNVVSDGGSAVTQRGICYSQTPNPTFFSQRLTAGSGTGLFTVQVIGLSPNTLYYVKAYAMNSVDTVYGDQLAVQTLPLAVPTVITMPAVTQSQSSVSSGGEVISDGGSPVTFRGVCWDTVPEPDVIDLKTWDGSGVGSYTSQITGLLLGKTYYIRAYAINFIGVAYGNEIQYSTTCTTYPPASVSISANSLSVCDGTSVTITATPVNGGANPGYQWYVNGENMGVTGAIFTYPPTNGDVVSCVMTSNLPCVSQNPAQSNTLTFNVNPLLQPQILVYPSATSVCSGTPVQFMASPVNGGTPSFQWKVNDSNVGGNNPIFYYTPSNLDKVHCVLTSSLQCVTSPTASSDTITLNVSSGLPVTAVISTTSTNVCAGSQVTFSAVVTNGGVDPDYQWMVNGSPAGNNSPQFTYVPVNGDVVTCLVNSSENCATGNPANSNSLPMTVNSVVSPSVTISASSANICSGQTVSFTASVVNGGQNPQYQWKINGQNVGTNSSSYSYNPANGDQVSCYLTSSAACASPISVQSNTIPMVVSPILPVSVYISASQNPVCSGSSVLFTASLTNPGNSPTIQWKVNGFPAGNGNIQFSYSPANNDVVLCELTSSLPCTPTTPSASNMVVMQVDPLLQPAISIAASSISVCNGTTVTFQATIVNGGTNPQYQWKVNDSNIGSNNSTFSYIPNNGDVVSCTLTTSVACPTTSQAQSNNIAITVNPQVPVSLSIAPSMNPVCGAQQVTVTATPINEGLNPLYQWMLNGVPVGTNSPVLTYVPSNTDQIICNLTSSAACPASNPVSSNMVVMQVNQPAELSVTVAPPGSVCAGSQVTLTANVTNGGDFPVFQWRKNGMPIGNNSPSLTFVPVNVDEIGLSVTSSLSCVTGSPYTISPLVLTVLPVPSPAVSVTPSANPVCNGTPVTYTANLTDAGLTPVLQWKVNGIPVGNGSQQFVYTPANNDAVVCEVLSSLPCAPTTPVSSLPVLMNVQPVSNLSVTITASDNPVCGQQQVDFTAQVQNGGDAPVYQWYVNNNPAGSGLPSFSYQPVTGDQVKCVVSSNQVCVTGSPDTSNIIIMQVNPVFEAAVTIAASNTSVCSGTLVAFTALPENGGPAPQFEWIVNNNTVGTGISFSYAPANGDNVRCKMISGLSCVSGSPALSNIVELSVTTHVTPSVTISASQQSICSGTPVTITAVSANGGAAPVYQWFKNGTLVQSGPEFTYTYTPANSLENVSCTMMSSEPCVTVNPAQSNVISVTVTNSLPASVSVTASATSVCQGSLVTFTAHPDYGGVSPVIQWYVNDTIRGTNSTTFNYIPANGDQVRCSLYSNAPCVTNNPAISNTIAMSVIPYVALNASITVSNNPVCEQQEVTFTSVVTNGGDNPVFEWFVNGNSVGGGLPEFSYVPDNNSSIHCKVTSGLTCVSGSPATTNQIDMQVNPLLPVSASIAASSASVCTGESVIFTATVINGGLNPVFQWYVDDQLQPGSNTEQFTIVPQNGNTVFCNITSDEVCQTGSPAHSNSIQVTVNDLVELTVGISASDLQVCEGAMVTFTANANPPSIQVQYQWKVNGIPAGLNQNAFSYSPLDHDIITCDVNSSVQCLSNTEATSYAIEIDVLPIVPVSIVISANQTNVCAGTLVMFSAQSVNAGSSPVYQWKVNGYNIGENQPEFSYEPVDNDVITCTLTSNEACAAPTMITSNAVPIDVNPNLVVDLQLSVSQNNICSGTVVQFSASAINEGDNPTYTWYVNSSIVPVSGPVYSYAPEHGDEVFCKVLSTEQCVVNSTDSSNLISMTVNALLSPVITISASENPVCAGGSVTFSATVINGGTSPTLNWYVDDQIQGVTGTVFTFTPADGNHISCELISSEPCTVSSSVFSNIITMETLPLQPFSVEINASATEICAGTEVIFTVNVANAGATPQFNWKVGGISQGINTNTFIYSPANGDHVWCDVTSSLPCAVDNPRQSDILIITVNQPLPVSVTINADKNNICAGTQVTFSAVPVNGGDLPAFQWYVNEGPSGNNSSSFTYEPQNTDNVTCRLTSSGSCVSNNPAISSPVGMIVNPILPVSVSISPSSNPVCAGSSVTITANAANGGTSPQYLWSVNDFQMPATGNILTYIPSDNDLVKCVLNSSSVCTSGNPASSEILALDVYTNLYVGSVSASQILCADNQPADLVATPPSNGFNPDYQWQKSENNIVFVNIPGATNQTYQPEIIPDTMYYRQLQNADETCGGPLPTNSVSVIMTPPAVVSVEIVSNVTGIIYQGSNVTFTASILNGGANPLFNWYVNSIMQENHTPVFTYSPANEDQVFCELYSDQSCIAGNPAYSNTITLTVSNDPLLPVAVSIAADPNVPVCNGTPVTFTATPGNGGESPVYQWKVNGNVVGSNSPVYTYPPASGDIVTCTMTSSLPNVLNNPAVSDPLVIEIIPLTPVSILIGASANPVCEGASVTFNAFAFNGGSNPSYTWLVNNEIKSAGSTATYSYYPQNGDEVACLLNSSLNCVSGNPALSNSSFMVVNPMSPVSVSIVPSENSVCAGTEVDFTAIPVNGGTVPNFQWKVNGISQGQNEDTFSYIPGNNDVITCVLTSDLVCASGNPATSDPVVMSVFQLAPVSVNIAVGQTSICQGTSVTIVATPANGGNTPVYQWKVNDNIVGGNSSVYSFVPVDNDIVVCELISSINCPSGNPAQSNQLVFHVQPVLPVSASITASSNPVCSGTSVLYNASVENGGTVPTYLWKVNGVSTGATSASYSYTPVNYDVVSCVVTSGLNCVSNNPATSNQITMTVNPIVTMSASISSSANNICAGTPVTYTLTTQNAGSSPVIQWKVNGSHVGTSANSYTYTPINGDQVTCTVSSTASCLTANIVNTNTITMTVNPVVTVSVALASSANPVCQGTNVTFSANYQNGGSSPVFSWKVNGQNVGSNLSTYSYAPANNDQISCTLTSNAICPNTSQVISTPIVMSVLPSAPVSVSISASENPACVGQQVTFEASATNPGSTPSYQWKINGANAGDGSPTLMYQPTDGDNILCVLNSSVNCATGNPATSETISMSVVQSRHASITITESANSVCAGTNVTFTTSVVNGGSNPVYQWAVNSVNVGNNSAVYAYVPLNGDAVTCSLTSNASCLEQNPVYSDTVTMTIAPSVAVSVTISTTMFNVCAGTSVTCTANPVNGGPNPTFQWTLNNVNVGNNSPTFTFTPVSGDKVRCKLTSSLNCFTGNSYALSNILSYTVNPVLNASVSIEATPSGAVCQGNNVVFSAIPTNPGTAPAYQWKVNGSNVSGATTNVYTYMPEPNDQVSCVMTSNATCVTGSPATSNTLQMTVNPSQAVSASVWASSYAVVSSTPVTYYAKSVNGGATPVYQWYVDNSLVSSGSSSYTYTPTNNQNVKCLITSSLSGCLMNNPASSNVVNMIVYTTGTACASGATLVHQGRTYNTVQVGTQCWLRENLNVGTQIAGTLTQTNNSQIEKYCYGNDSLNCNMYGGLYQWAEAVQYLNNVTNTTHWSPLPTTPVKGLCPDGWHIPSKAEYETMFTYLGGTTVAGGKLKEAGTVHWNSPNSGATNSSGFSMLPSGYVLSGIFQNSKSYGYIWTITKGSLNDHALYFGSAYNYSTTSTGQSNKATGIPIRCLKD